MGYTARRGTDDAFYAVVAALNATRRGAAVVASFFHADVTADTTGSLNALAVVNATVTAANATDLPTALVLVNQVRQRWLQHRNDDLAHKVSDGTPTLTAGVATDLATAEALANEIKGDRNTHLASTTYHYTADGTNTTTSTDATDLASLLTLVNELKADHNAHIVSAPAGQSVKLIDP